MEDLAKTRNFSDEFGQERYIGERNNQNQKHGKGMLIGMEYEYDGQWDHDLRHGEGRAKYKSGTMYFGRWAKGKKEGQGKLIECEDSIIVGRYEGNFSNDLKHGYGVQELKNGMVYEGNFFNDKFDGKGTLKDSVTNYKYEGNFEDGKAQGYGAESYKTGSNYVGEFHRGFKHGKGSLSIPYNNYEYIGDWEYGVQQGYGVEIFGPKMNLPEDYEEKRGICRKFSRTRVMYEGDFWNNQRHGVGLELQQNGDFYYGGWVFGKKEGLGLTYTKSNTSWDLYPYVKGEKSGVVIKHDDKDLPEIFSGYFHTIDQVFVGKTPYEDKEFTKDAANYYYLTQDRLRPLNIDVTVIKFIRLSVINPQIYFQPFAVVFAYEAKCRGQDRREQMP